MTKIAASHGYPSKKDRRKKVSFNPKYGWLHTNKEYDRVDAIIDEVYADIANGFSRSEIIAKVLEGGYTDCNIKKKDQAEAYYETAMNRMAYDCDEKAEVLRQKFFTRYETLYKEAVDNGDVANARAVLTDMCKIFGLQVKDQAQTAIQINSSKEDGVTINFGFNDNKEEENKEAEE